MQVIKYYQLRLRPQLYRSIQNALSNQIKVSERENKHLISYIATLTFDSATMFYIDVIILSPCW